MTDKPSTTPKSRKRASNEGLPTLVALTSDAQTETREVPPTASGESKVSKISKVVTLLSREQGATLDELIAVTGWQPHTTRAALTGLKKKGHVIERNQREDVSCYRTKVPE